MSRHFRSARAAARLVILLAVMAFVLVGAGSAHATWNLTISDEATTTVIDTNPDPSLVTFEPDGAVPAVLNIDDLETALGVGNVRIDTTGIGGATEDGDILLDGVTEITGAGSSFTLVAVGDIHVPGFTSNGGTIDVTANGSIVLDGSIDAATALFHSPVVLTGNRQVFASNIEFASGVDGAYDLGVGESGATVTFGSPSSAGHVGGVTPLSSLMISGSDANVYGNLHAVAPPIFEPAVVDLLGSTTQTITSDTLTLTVPGLSAGSTIHDVVLAAPNISMQGNLTGFGTVTLNAANQTTLVNGLTTNSKLVTDAPGYTRFEQITATADIEIIDSAELSTDASITATGAEVTLSEVRSPNESALTVSASTVLLNGQIGLLQPIGALTVTGATTLNGDVRAQGDITLNSAVTLLTDAVLAAGYDTVGDLVGPAVITFGSTVAGGHALDLDATNRVIFNGAVGGTVNLASVHSSSPTEIKSTVTTTGAQTYDASVTQTGATSGIHGGTSGSIVNRIDGVLTLMDAGTFTLSGSGTTTLHSGVAGTSGTTLVRDGAGKAVIEGVSTFAGTYEARSGTLNIDGTNATAALRLTGGSAGGTGSIGSIGSSTSGSIAHVTTNTGFDTLNVGGNVTLASTVSLAPKLGFNGTIIGSDLIGVGGDVALAGATLAPDVIGAAQAAGTVYTIVSAAGAINGKLRYGSSLLNEGDGFVTGDAYYVINYGAHTVTLTRQLAPTTTTVTTSPATTGAFNQAVTLTATVEGPLALGPEGNVEFRIDGVLQEPGLVTLANSGPRTSTASLTLPPGGVVGGVHSITATYIAATGYLASTSLPVSFAVTKQAAALTLAQNVTTSIPGGGVRLTATLNTGVAIDGQMVAFKDGATTLVTVPIVTGVAIVSIGSLGEGPHTLTAVFAGDASTLAATSNPVTHTVVRQSTSITLTAPSAPQVLGAAVTVTANVTANGSVAPSGSVTFRDGPTVLGTIPVGGGGRTTFTTTSLALGDHALTASYGGDGVSSSSTSGALTVRIVAPTPPAPPLPVVKVGKVPPATSIASLIKSGLVTKVSTTQPGTVTSQLTIPAVLAKRLKLIPMSSKQSAPVVIGTTTLRVTKAGTVTIASKLTRPAKKAMAKLKNVQMVQKITVKSAAGSRIATRIVTIRRAR